MSGESVAMADDLQTGICSDNWWNSSRTGLNGLSTPCSMSPIDVGSFGWTDMAGSCEEPASILDTTIEKPQLSNSIGSGSFLIDSMAGFGLLATPVVDWSEPLLQSRGRAESNLHTILHEDSTSTESLLSSCKDDSINAFKQMNQSLNIIHSNPQPPQQIFDNHPMNYANLNEILINVGSNSNRFSQTRFLSSTFDVKPNIRNLMPKLSTEVHRLSSKSEIETTSKRPRIETPSPLPTFKVRKEKLGDRITALQQLVSPFGKTDTASVLSEAIEYIKFLHDQVNVLSTHYVKNGASMQHQQNSEKWKDENDGERDLRSRGLCLVPISSTFPVTTVATTDFWTPIMGASFK